MPSVSMPYNNNKGQSSVAPQNSYLDKNGNYSKAAEDAADRSANRQSARTRAEAQDFFQIAQKTRSEDFSRGQIAAEDERRFKSSESSRDRSQSNEQFDKKINQENLERDYKFRQSDSDRKKSADEFAQNANRDLLKLQVDGNNKRGDVAVEATRAYRDQGFRDISEANAARYQKDLAQTNIAGQKDLANIAQQTAFGEQKSSIERAKEAAKAQVTSALYGSSRQYQGY